MPWLLFWMQTPFGEVSDEDWNQYLSAFSWEFLVIALVFVALICGTYAYCTRRLTFDHLLRRFWPVRLLWIAIIAGLVIGIRAYRVFDSFENLSGKEGGIPAALSSGFWSTVIVVILSWFTFLLPGVTPAMFRYRPVKWIVRLLNRGN